jgi:hypothetical protein
MLLEATACPREKAAVHDVGCLPSAAEERMKGKRSEDVFFKVA